MPGNRNDKFMNAVRTGNINYITSYINRGGNVNRVSKLGWTPLMLASMGKTEVVKLLLKNGADVNQTNKDGATPLSVASSEGFVDVVKVLLKAGAKVNKAEKKERVYASFICNR